LGQVQLQLATKELQQGGTDEGTTQAILLRESVEDFSENEEQPPRGDEEVFTQERIIEGVGDGDLVSPPVAEEGDDDGESTGSENLLGDEVIETADEGGDDDDGDEKVEPVGGNEQVIAPPPPPPPMDQYQEDGGSETQTEDDDEETSEGDGDIPTQPPPTPKVEKEVEDKGKQGPDDDEGYFKLEEPEGGGKAPSDDDRVVVEPALDVSVIGSVVPETPEIPPSPKPPAPAADGDAPAEATGITPTASIAAGNYVADLQPDAYSPTIDQRPVAGEKEDQAPAPPPSDAAEVTEKYGNDAPDPIAAAEDNDIEPQPNTAAPPSINQSPVAVVEEKDQAVVTEEHVEPVHTTEPSQRGRRRRGREEAPQEEAASSSVPMRSTKRTRKEAETADKAPATVDEGTKQPPMEIDDLALSGADNEPEAKSKKKRPAKATKASKQAGSGSGGGERHGPHKSGNVDCGEPEGGGDSVATADASVGSRRSTRSGHQGGEASSITQEVAGGTKGRSSRASSQKETVASSLANQPVKKVSTKEGDEKESEQPHAKGRTRKKASQAPADPSSHDAVEEVKSKLGKRKEEADVPQPSQVKGRTRKKTPHVVAGPSSHEANEEDQSKADVISTTESQHTAASSSSGGGGRPSRASRATSLGDSSQHGMGLRGNREKLKIAFTSVDRGTQEESQLKVIKAEGVSEAKLDSSHCLKVW